MRAIAYDRPGTTEVLEVIDKPLTEPGPNEVRVRIFVAGVNPTDIDARRRRSGSVPYANPHVPGQDGAGMVDAVGTQVHDLTIGDRVWVWDAEWHRADGTAQEYVVLPARQVVPLPANASYDIGASLGIPALTAHRALTSFAEGPLELCPGALAGKTVLVAGGAGAVGNAAIQLAAWSGAEVVSTVNGIDKAALAKAAGAHHVIDYRATEVKHELKRVARHGVDLIVEVNAKENLDTDLDVVAPHGGISIYTPGGGTTYVPSFPAMTKNIQFSFILTYTTTSEQKDRAVRAVTAAVASGGFGVGVDRGLPLTRFPLDQTARAHAAVEHHAVGKVLIDVTGS